MKRIAILGFVLLVQPAPFVFAEPAPTEKIRLAVIDLAVGEGVSSDEGKMLTMFIRDAIVKAGKFEVMDRQRVADIFAEQNFSAAVCDNTQCLVKAGKLLDVNRIAGGRVGRFGNNWTLAMSLVDVNLGKVINSQTLADAGTKENLLQIAPMAGVTLLGLSSASAPPSVALAVQNGFVNSLGMKFILVPGPQALFCIWETRVRDYVVYASANHGVDGSWKNVTYKGVPVSDGPDYPVVNVKWKDAKAFCQWLTQKERSAGLIGPKRFYRLPTDLEWSAAVGLNNESGSTPKERNGREQHVFPWGTEYYPPQGAGNYLDQTAKFAFNLSSCLSNSDGYATTAPVGSFRPNPHGLFDLGGNVWEWCEDFYDGQSGSHVLRGGSYLIYGQDRTMSCARGVITPSDGYYDVGFRVVLASGYSR